MFSNTQRKIALVTTALVFTLLALFAAVSVVSSNAVETTMAEPVVEVALLHCSIFGICFGWPS